MYDLFDNVVGHSPKNGFRRGLCRVLTEPTLSEPRSSLLEPHQGRRVSSQTLYCSQGHQYNLPLDGNFCLKIIDFDIAMQVKDKNDEVNDECGTKRWMAPEIGEVQPDQGRPVVNRASSSVSS